MVDYINELRFMAEDLHSGVGCVPEVKTLSGAADEIERLEKSLAESQAREAKLRAAIIEAHRWSPDKSASKHLLGEAMYSPHDDTALKEYKRKVLMDAASRLVGYGEAAYIVSNMAEDV